MIKKDYKTLELSPKYIPKKSEEYMSLEQKAYFYQLLEAQKAEAVTESDSVLSAVKMAEKTSTSGVGDDSDKTVFEQEVNMSLRMSERNSNLIKKINVCLERLESNTYGYSVISGDEIGLQRMLARPLATLTIEEQEDIEKNER